MTKHGTKELSPKIIPRTVLLIDDDVDFAHQVERTLYRDDENKYYVIWKRTGNDAVYELQRRTDIHVVLLEYFLPDQTGLDVVRKLGDLKLQIPTIFLSVNKDFDIAVEMMKCGVRDYIVKSEFSLQSLPAVVSRVYDDYRQRDELITREITKQRIVAMRELIARIINELEQPTVEMKRIISNLNKFSQNKPYRQFIDILGENISRIIQRVEKLRNLDTDKTVRYIKDIRMIDLS